MKDALAQLAEKVAARLNLSTAGRAAREARDTLAQREVNAPLLSFIRSRPWAITAQGLKGLASHATSRLDVSLEDFFELRPESKIKDGTGYVYVHGALVDSCPAIYEKLGLVTRYSTITRDLADLTAQGAKQIVLVFNSPGGTVAGVKEAADAIAASPIPISSYCAGLACSAAYYLAAGTKRITASPSATVGNIGTILSWGDDTEFWNAIGIEWKAIFNEGADLKSTFHLEPDEAQLAFLQESINEAGRAFGDHVRKHRAGISSEVFRAGWYSGEKAKALGLVDAIGKLDVAVSTGSTSGPAAKVQPASPKALKPAAAPAATVPPSPKSTTLPPTSKPTSIQMPTTPQASRPHAKTPIAELLAMAGKVMATPASRQAALAEIDQRPGYFTIGAAVFANYGQFLMMTAGEREAFQAVGGRMAGGNPTSAEKASGSVDAFILRITERKPRKLEFGVDPHDYIFPVRAEKQRTVDDFLRLDREEIQHIGKQCGLPCGIALRRELFEASWSIRHETGEDGASRSRKFQNIFSDAFQAIRRLGPNETDNDEIPEIPHAVGAADLLALPEASITDLNQRASFPTGRGTRREIKAAYVAASGALKISLKTRFKSALEHSLDEFI